MPASASSRPEPGIPAAWARDAPSRRVSRLPFLAAGGVSLLLGIWVGLRRAGWRLPLAPGTELADHAALMVSGFLGTLIGLERAVALRIPWTFLSPALSGLGGLLLLSGVSRALPAALFTAASVVLALAYLLLQLPSLAWATFRTCAVLHGAAVVVALPAPWLAFRLSGLAFLGWALWLVRHDVARRTVRTPGLPRFAAVGLLAGYAWLFLAGVLWITSPGLPAGLRYDAEMHTLFLGFVFSMVFAHAPIIWPSVLGGQVQFRPRFYGHLVLLHLSVLLRVASDLAAWEGGRRWAVLLNTLALPLFLANTVGRISGRPTKR